MIDIRRVLLVGSLLLSHACGDDEAGAVDGGAAWLDRACDALCETTVELACDNDPGASDCIDQCADQYTSAMELGCGDEGMAFYDCLRSVPRSQWECGADGEAGLESGCAPEIQAYFACLQAPDGGS
jgi:hypothetical protein